MTEHCAIFIQLLCGALICIFNFVMYLAYYDRSDLVGRTLESRSRIGQLRLCLFLVVESMSWIMYGLLSDNCDEFRCSGNFPPCILA